MDTEKTKKLIAALAQTEQQKIQAHQALLIHIAHTIASAVPEVDLDEQLRLLPRPSTILWASEQGPDPRILALRSDIETELARIFPELMIEVDTDLVQQPKTSLYRVHFRLLLHGIAEIGTEARPQPFDLRIISED